MAGGDGEARIRRALWGSLVALGVVGLAGLAVALLAGRPAPPAGPEAPAKRSAPATPVSIAPALPFTDVTAAAGIGFVHHTGAAGERLLPETMGGAVAFFDYDADGHADLLFIDTAPPSAQQPPAERASGSRLYRNNGRGLFTDVTAATGLSSALAGLHGMGAATGDYDGDGLIDIFITAIGRNRLLRNLGGRFEDRTDAAGVAGAASAWSTGAAFLDSDGDADLDLFVCNYVAWSPAIDRAVNYRLTGIGRAYGPPTDFAGTDSVLYRNDGGVFTDISAAAGVRVRNPATGEPVGKALAVRPVDVNDDGRLDLAVANDTVGNFLFINQGDGSFAERGAERGFAFDPAGAATGAMGIDAAHYANDGRLAVAIGNFGNEMSSFYVQRPGERLFSDDAIVAGVGPASRRALTFGLLFADLDLDGRVDLIAANGHVEPDINRVQASQRYRQPAQLFWNCGAACGWRHVLVPDTGALAAPRAGRGLAYADIDGDGDLDLALAQVGARAVLLRNDQALGHHYARVTLRDALPNTHAIGATVTVTAGGATMRRTVMPTRSYLSQVELPLTFGLGAAGQVDAVTVRWPDGAIERWPSLPVDEHVTLERGGGRG